MFKCCVCSEIPKHIKLQLHLNFRTVTMSATKTMPKKWNKLHKLITNLMARPKLEDGVSDAVVSWLHCFVSELHKHLFSDNSIFTSNYKVLHNINISWYRRAFILTNSIYSSTHKLYNSKLSRPVLDPFTMCSTMYAIYPTYPLIIKCSHFRTAIPANTVTVPSTSFKTPDIKLAWTQCFLLSSNQWRSIQNLPGIIVFFLFYRRTFHRLFWSWWLCFGLPCVLALSRRFITLTKTRYPHTQPAWHLIFHTG